jgi:hypothetical protein
MNDKLHLNVAGFGTRHLAALLPHQSINVEARKSGDTAFMLDYNQT